MTTVLASATSVTMNIEEQTDSRSSMTRLRDFIDWRIGSTSSGLATQFDVSSYLTAPHSGQMTKGCSNPL